MVQNPPPIQVVISATDQTRQAIAQARAGFEGLKASATGLQSVLVGATAALAGLAVVLQFQKFVESAAALDDLAEKTGASVEKLSALAQVARISGTSIDVVESALTRLAKGLAGADEESKGAGNALAALGLKAKDLKNLDTADSLKIVADRLNQYKDGAGKTALAIDLLGKSGAQALPYLKDLAETQELVGRVTAEQAAQAENLQKNLVRLSVSTSEAWREFSAAVLPTVDAFVESLLKAANGSGGLRDEIQRLSKDGSLRDWAESAAIGIAYLVDAIRNVINSINLAGATTATLVIGLELALAKARASAERGRSSQFSRFEKEVKDLRILKNEAEAGVSEAFNKFVNAPQFSTAVRERFAALRDAAQASPADTRKQLKYSSIVDTDKAKDELKSIESYVAQIREQLVGATEGEFQKMRQKAQDVFGQIDFSALSKIDKGRFADAFAEITEAIDTLEKRASDTQNLKGLADSFDAMAKNAQAAAGAVSGFNDAMATQARDLQFELEMVGKLASERQRLTAARQIDANARRAVAGLDTESAGYSEAVSQIYALAEEAKKQVLELNTQLRTTSRDGFGGLQVAANEYFDRISNDAANFAQAFNGIMGSLENAFVRFAETGKLEFKGLVTSIIADLVRIQVRQSITGPIAKAIGSGGGLGSLFGNVFGGGDILMDGLRPAGFARGGRPPLGVPSIVGELGPELFVPDSAGTVIPNGAFGGVVVNVINNGQPVSAEASAPRFDGSKMIIDVVLNAARTNGGFRQGLRSVMGAPT